MSEQTLTDTTRETIAALLDAFRRNDIDELVGYYAEEVDWLFHMPPSVFPFAGVRRTRADLRVGFSILFTQFRFTSYVTEQSLVDGANVATLGTGSIEQVSSGRRITLKTANFYRFENGLVVMYRGYTDSLDAVEQVLGRELDITS